MLKLYGANACVTTAYQSMGVNHVINCRKHIPSWGFPGM